MTNEIILYSTPEGNKKVGVLYHDESFWMTQKAIAELFDVEVPAISKHLGNIYDSGELEREATISILETVRREGNRNVKRKLEYYNLDAIIAVGYRVNSYQATQFRVWATKTLKEFIIKGYVLDDERLRQEKHYGSCADTVILPISRRKRLRPSWNRRRFSAGSGWLYDLH
ncbi:Virulence protein-like protein [Desulfonatronospira thiodismutans ASO3-1]|uniref:Virulence protein-like protein n=1 Tax=Desulfonatronospira thiodismutans ASO3-1 TaxID=555779 RepID=D6SU20_9BACT|nr:MULTISPECIES: RhuM family protein [Desulfonatronospira]EFI33111.1 Virulence protein-like protein [Desulfonatronospira thiodismutans ASO3-1]RQD75216.1 MAG: virulence protein [Desulfonatronospira sp. MSAO_Bac3]